MESRNVTPQTATGYSENIPVFTLLSLTHFYIAGVGDQLTLNSELPKTTSVKTKPKNETNTVLMADLKLEVFEQTRQKYHLC